MPYVEAESFVRDWLATHLAPTRVVTELPAGLATQVPLVQVTRFGGADDSLVLDSANIDVDTFAASRGAARTLGEQVRYALLFQMRGYANAGASVQSVTTISAPRWVPFDDTSLRRFVASYRITIHSIP